MIEASALDELAYFAQASKVAAALLRFAAACAVAFAGLLVLALGVALIDRTAAEPPASLSASAYLDFDLAVLRTLATRSLAAAGDDEHRALSAMWSARPDWQRPAAREGRLRLVSPRDAWAAATAEKSRFRTAARGAADALPFLLGGLGLVLLTAAAAGALAEAPRRRAALVAGIALCILLPLWPMLDPALFYDRTRSMGRGLFACFFVAAFAGAMSGAAARALFTGEHPARHLGAPGKRPPLLLAARLAAIECAEWLLSLVPALAAAAVFVCAKADQDPGISSAKSGLGALIRSALREPGWSERLGSSALVAGALLLLWFVGARFVLEVQSALGGRGKRT